MTQPPYGDVPAEDPPTGYGPAPGYRPLPGYQPAPPGYRPPPAYGPPAPYGYPPPGYGYPPPGYGYPPPGYGYQPAGPPQDKPPSNIGWAIAALLMFWPLAIPAFIFSGKVDSAWNIGDRGGAESASRSARQYGLIGVVVGAVLIVLALVWVIVVFAFLADTVKNFPTITPTP